LDGISIEGDPAALIRLDGASAGADPEELIRLAGGASTVELIPWALEGWPVLISTR